MNRTTPLLLSLVTIAVIAPTKSSAQTPPVEVERGSPNRQAPVDKSKPAPKPPMQAPATAAPKVAFEKHTLPNGLQLILHVDRKLPIVHVNQWFHVGSKNEKPGRTGFAHLFEHMMFQGSKNVQGEYFTVAEKLGANVQEGGVNGTTDNDRTNYFATVPSGNLEALLWLESDRLATLLDVTDLKKLDNQRDVVKNERREGLENQPYGRWIDILFNQLFPAGHPYSWPVIGSMEDLSAASLDDVKEFFRRYYTSNNLSMVIAGDFDPAEAKKLVEKYFGGLPPGPALDRPDRWIATLDDERIVEVADRVPQERTYMVWPAPEYFHKDDAAMTLTSTVLTDGLSSRLNKALVYDKPLCTAVNSFPLAAEIGGAFVVIATARPGVSLAEIERIVGEEIARLAKTGPTAAELERAKTKQEFTFISGLERIGGFGGKADLLNQYNVYLGDPGKFDADLARHRAVTQADLANAVNRWLNTRNRLLIRFHPETSGRPADVALDRSKQPAEGADRPFKAPSVSTAKLENGLEVLVVERSDLPKVAVTLATRAGATADPVGKAGLAAMTVRTIDMGTKTRKALEIETAFGDLGVTLGGSTGRESANLSFEVLERNVGPALSLLSDVVRNATFPASEVEREKKRQIDALRQQENNSGAIASRVRNILAFGPDHPYGHPSQGLPRTIESLSPADLASFHGTHWKPGSSAIVFVGSLSLAKATELARQHFGTWTGGAAPSVAIPPAQGVPGGRIYLVDRQDAAQTSIHQFLPAPKRQTEDYYPLLLADAVWGGGGFGTRLNLNLREDKGYSYGVFSDLAAYRDGGIWYAAGDVQSNRTAESVAEFHKELRALAGERPISDDEFSSAKLTKARGYAQRFEAYSRVSGEVAGLWALGLPMSELQREYDETVKADLGATIAAAKKYASPERATLVLVGDRGAIEAGVRGLKLGEIVVVDVEGRPVGQSPATQVPGGDARAAFDEANALFGKAENDKALAAYDRAIALDPKQPDYHVGRCRTLARLMRHNEAIESCSNALKIDPNHAAALLERGHFLINIRQAEKAIPDLIKARQLGADAYGVGYHLPLAYYVTGDFKKAAEEYPHCYANAKTDDNRVACTAWEYVALVRAGRKEDADKVLARVTPETKVQSSAAYLDRLLLFKGLKKEEDVAQAMQKDNLQLPTVAYGLGVWHLVNGRQARAREYFEKATAPPAQQSGFGSVASYYELQRLKQ